MTVINTVCNCSMGPHGEVCGGFWQNRARLTDWMVCQDCGGTGYPKGTKMHTLSEHWLGTLPVTSMPGHPQHVD